MPSTPRDGTVFELARGALRPPALVLRRLRDALPALSRESDLGACPSCGSPVLVAAGVPEGAPRKVCERCGRCWERGDDPADWVEVDTLECEGCPERPVCESRPTSLVGERTRMLTLRDGSRLLVRPLLYSDRAEIVAGYEQLSDESRRLRFFTAGDHLSARELDYLVNLDYDDRFAWAAFLPDEPGAPGVGVARYIRDRDDPAMAEIAATVTDEYQGRGIGTRLVVQLADEARAHGISTFVAHVLWENERALEPLRELGARITAEEPGVARIELDLPERPVDVEDAVVAVLTRISPHLGTRARPLG